MVFFDLEWKEQTKLDYYLAQIATEIRIFREGFMKNPQAVAVMDMILKFVSEAEKEAEKERQEEWENQLTPEEIWAMKKQKSNEMKGVFAAALGVELPD